jgi:two-component system chemotaxis response regulator CheY
MVRNDPVHKAIPIVIITTEGADEDRKRGLALGANAYIAKPIQTADLLNVVNQIISGRST